MSNRIRGEEVELILLVDGSPRDNFSFIRSTEITFKSELKEEGYLNETTQRYDTIFNGISGKAEAHFDSPEVLTIIRLAVDKARRRTPGTRFNIKQTLNFPSGRRARIIIPDIEFGPLPIKFGGRASYGEFSLDYAASNAYSLIV